MSEISPLGRAAGASPVQSGQTPATGGPSPDAIRQADQVDVSHAARLLNQLAELPDVRFELVERVRSEIAAGTYETPEKLDQAITELLQDLI